MLPTVRNMILNITEKTYIKILQIDVRKAEYEIQILMKGIPAGIQGVIKNILTEKSSTSRNYSSDTRRSQGRNSSGNSGQSGRRSRYNDSEPEDRDVSYYDDVYEEPVDTYDDFERRQQRKRQMDIENMADYDDLKSTEATDTEDYDEWKDN